ncbi:MAG TPA: hypothetical protein VFL94_14050 [Actinomycetales bacterium]|nr:hypothetical protein [Actinomycetales bacterium]
MELAAGAREAWAALVVEQDGVVSRQQALGVGWTTGQIETHCRRGRWRRLHPGVYAAFTGEVTWRGRLWAGLLHAGAGAVASHRSAGRLQRLVDTDPDVVELLVPWGHRVTAQPGLVVRSSRHLSARRQPARSLPQTRVEETVLDLVELCMRDDDVVGWLTRACQRGLTTPTRLQSALAGRQRLRHRPLVRDALADVVSGVASPLESRYHRDVERSHGLPRASRGERVTVEGRHWYADVRYRAYRLRVELEGLRWHAGEDRWRDAARDNAAVLSGDVVLRYDWRAVAGAPCATARQVAGVLRTRGWPGAVRTCGPACAASD